MKVSVCECGLVGILGWVGGGGTVFVGALVVRSRA